MAQNYNEFKNKRAEIQREASLAGRDIAPLPKVVKPKRRKLCRLDFRLFCETYYPQIFNLEWSTDHLKVIAIIQKSMLEGGLGAVAMPRGSGKTSLATCAAEWALLYGHRRFVVLIGASETHAANILSNIAVDFSSNDLLLQDFPEVCYPIRKLDGIVHRAAGQLLNGARTLIHWTKKELVLPTVPKSAASGGIVRVAGITGSFRGMAVMNPSDGKKVRPDFVLIDDPQDDESARSPKQNADRLNILNGAILGLAGAGKKIAGVMPLTVIAKGDMADQVLDRKKHPEWQGQRTKMLRSMPKDVKLWEQYAELRSKGLQEERGLADATTFYLANRTALDDGADASWPARFNPDEASAVQHAMNLKLRDEASFAAEYQNEPLSLDAVTPLMLTAEQISAKAVKVGRGVVPDQAAKLVAFIDVMKPALFYTVLAVNADFTAHVVDYGTFPQQKRGYFFLRETEPTLQTLFPGLALEAQIIKGLNELSAILLGRDWQRHSGGTTKIDRLVVDSGYEEDAVSLFCRGSALTIPSKGFGVKAEVRPMNSWKADQGERVGWNWRLKSMPQLLRYDTNAWKTFVAQRFLSAVGEAGNLSIFDGTAIQHKMFSDHATAEYPTPVEGLGRVVNVWRERPNRENHFLDCLIGCYAAASEQGIRFVGHDDGTGNKPVGKRRKVQVNF